MVSVRGVHSLAAFQPYRRRRVRYFRDAPFCIDNATFQTSDQRPASGDMVRSVYAGRRTAAGGRGTNELLVLVSVRSYDEFLCAFFGGECLGE